MQDKKTDRRVNRTRRMLHEALMSLVAGGDFDNITIEDICNRADVGRTTFYLHYRDKDDLLLECINDAIEDLVAQVSGLPIANWKEYFVESGEELPSLNPILLIFQHAAENASLYQIIMRGGSASQTQSRVREIIANAVTNYLLSKVESEGLTFNPQIPLEVFANYFAGSLMGIMSWWLEVGLPYSPAQMTTIFQKLFFPGAGKVLGVSFP